MTDLDVCWLTADPEGEDARGFWDQTIIEHLFARLAANYGVRWTHHRGVPPGVQGCVLVVKAGFDDPEHIQKIIRKLKWVVLFSTSDEEQRFPWWDLTHRRMTRWVSSAKAPHLESADHLIPVGPTPHGMAIPGRVSDPWNRPHAWGFLGQMTHERRAQAMAAMAPIPLGYMRTSFGFAQGLDPEEYAAKMTAFRFAPAPGGPVSPDTFRAWESIYAGCVPLLDMYADNGSGEGLWQAMFPDGALMPIVSDWETELVEMKMEWAPPAYVIQGWWGLQLYRWQKALVDDLAMVAGIVIDRPPLSVIINTSPITDNEGVFAATLDSAREAFGDHVPYIVIADGVRPEQEHLRNDYEQFLEGLAWDSLHHMTPNFYLLAATEQVHQVELMRRVLPYLETTALAFLEHDTPVLGDIPAYVMAAAVVGSTVDLIRLYPELEIPAEHGYLMRGADTVNGLAVQRTVQWSQRPHIASVALYEELLAKEFTPEARTFIEDKMHSVAQHRDSPYRLAIFTPPGSIKRSTHLDGRQGEPKFDDRLVF